MALDVVLFVFQTVCPFVPPHPFHKEPLKPSSSAGYDDAIMEALKQIKVLVCDSDGVLTDGSIFVSDDGIEHRRFHVRDGLGMKLAQKAGLRIGVISGRSTRSATLRLAGLEVDFVMQGISDKGAALESLSRQAGVSLSQIAYLGDDIIDLPALKRCGFPVAVNDAVAEVKAVAAYTTQAVGGRGAVRETIELILRAQGRWDEIVRSF